VTLLERLPFLKRFTVTKPSLSLTITLPVSNYIKTIGIAVTVSEQVKVQSYLKFIIKYFIKAYVAITNKLCNYCGHIEFIWLNTTATIN